MQSDKAGGRQFPRGWPGKNAVAKLAEAKIEVKIKRNPENFHASEICQPVKAMLLVPSQRILRAIGEGWITMKYTGTTIEGCAGEEAESNEEDEEDEGSDDEP